MQMQAYSAARDILFNGKHTIESLVSLASSPGRSVIPFYDLYSDYFNSVNYGHELIINSVDDPNMDLTSLQQRIFVLRFAQALVLEHAALEKIYYSVQACESNTSKTEAMKSWDAAAGLLIGSVKRAAETKSSNWFAPFDLAQEHCQEFGTCEGNDPIKIAQTNKELTELLYAGRGAAMTGSGCGALKRIAGEVSRYLLVPIIQATLSASIRLSSTSRNPSEEDLAESFVFSRVLLPRIRDVNAEVATSMEGLLTLNPKSISSSTAESMFALFRSVYENLGIPCEAIGVTKQFDACKGPVKEIVSNNGDEDKSALWIVVGIVAGFVGLFALLVCAGGFYYRYRWRFVNFGKKPSPGSNEVLPRAKSFGGGRSLSSQASKKLDLIVSYGDDEIGDGLSSVESFTGIQNSANKPNPGETFSGGDLAAMKEEDERVSEELSTTQQDVSFNTYEAGTSSEDDQSNTHQEETFDDEDSSVYTTDEASELTERKNNTSNGNMSVGSSDTPGSII